MASISEAVTRGLRVRAEAHFVPSKSLPEDGQWFFTYAIRITNESEEVVQLLSRHWIITDGNGHTEEVRGPGVIGEQPVLRPGEVFQYASNCPLQTPLGTMHGTFLMLLEGGQRSLHAQRAPPCDLVWGGRAPLPGPRPARSHHSQAPGCGSPSTGTQKRPSETSFCPPRRDAASTRSQRSGALLRG